MSEPSLYDQLGGERKLRLIVNDFVDRVVRDTMIGFFFRNVDVHRLKELEFQFAARALGGPTEYDGRPLQRAHQAHPIMGGQFARRKKILADTLQAHQAPANVVEAWLEHTESLRPLITQDGGSDCDPDAALARIKTND